MKVYKIKNLKTGQFLSSGERLWTKKESYGSTFVSKTIAVDIWTSLKSRKGMEHSALVEYELGEGIIMSNTNFEAMTTKQAIHYCNEHKDEYIKDNGSDGQRQFDCLITILECGTIKPSELPDYGMEY